MADFAQASDRAPTPTFPSAPGGYNQYDEANFRRQVERTFIDVITYASRLTRQGGDLVFDADQNELPFIETAAYKTIEDMHTVFHSAGWISGGVISAAAAPAKLAEDTFTDTNGVQLTAHTADSGFGQWAGISYFTIQSNQAQSASAFNRRTHTGNAITSGKTVFTVEATLTNASSDGLGSWGFGWHSDTQTNVALYTRTYIRCAQLSGPSERMNIYLGYQYSNIRSEEVLIGSAKAWAWSAAKKFGVVVDVTTATPNYTVWWSDTDDSNYEVLCTDQEFVSNVPVVTNHYCDLYQDQASTEKYYVDNFSIYDGEWLGGTPGVDVTAGEGLVRDGTSNLDTLYFCEWAASTGNDAPAEGAVKFVGVEYNAGAPQVVLADTRAWDYQTDWPLGSVIYENSTIHVFADKFQVADHAGQMIRRLYETAPFAYDALSGGVVLGETGTRNLTLSAGAFWHGLTRHAVSAIDTSASGTFETYYRNSPSGWVRATGVTQWPNTQYDNGSGTLQTLTNNWFGVLWFYVDLENGELLMLYGRGNYTTATLAEAEEPPSVPVRIRYHGVLIARAIFQKGASTFTAIDSAFALQFNPIGTAVEGTGTIGTIPKWSKSQELDDSIITDDGAYTITIGDAINGGDLTVHGNVDLPTIGIIRMGVGAAYGQITLDTGQGVGISSPKDVVIDIDADNDETTRVFRVRKDLATEVLSVTEGGLLKVANTLEITHTSVYGMIDSVTGDLQLHANAVNYWRVEATTGTLTPSLGGGLGNESEGVGSIYVTNGSKWYVVGNTNCNIGLKYSGQAVWESDTGFRIKLDSDSNSSTETFVIGHGAVLTEVFTVAESGQVDIATGPLTIGTPSTEDSLLNVGGKARFDNWDMTHASGYDEGLVVSGTHSVATTGGPIGAAFYMSATHTTGSVAELYGVDIGAWNTSTGTVAWGTALEIWGGTDSGAITALDLLYIISPWGTITTATGIRIDDISAGSTNYAIYTGAGQVRFGDQVRVTDGSNNVYVNKTGSAIFECGTDGSADSTYIRAGNQSSPATNNPAYYWSIRSDNSIMIYGYDGSTYRNLWEWNYATNSVKAKAATFYIDSTQVLPTVANTTSIGSSTYYVTDIYLQRVRANSYLYVYPYVSGTGGGFLYLEGYAGTPTWYCRASTGTYSSKAAIGSYSSLGVWAGQGWDGTNWYTGASITLASAGSAWSGTDHGSNIYFATTAEASTTLTTRWRILPAGDFIPYADNSYDLGHSSYRVQDIHAMGLYCTADYAVVNPASSAESLPTNMTNGLIVRRDGGTAPAFNSAHVAGFISASAAGTNALVSIISGNTGAASLYFGDTDNYGAGGVLYDNSNNRMQFRAGGVTYMTLISNGDLCVRDPNLSELGTTATGGFLRIPSVNGVPTGTPSAFTGTLALVYDRANNDLYVYNGAWKKVALA